MARHRRQTPAHIVRNRIVAACVALAVIATLWVTFTSLRTLGTEVPATAASASAKATAASSAASGSAAPSASPSEAFNVYGKTAPTDLAEVVKSHKPLVYVPNTLTNTVQVIDPTTYQIVAKYPTGREPHHVVPSWDLKTLYVNDTQGNDVLPIDPATGEPGAKIPVEDPYNLYWTPDGKFGLIMAERLHRIDAVDPKTFQIDHSLTVPCNGVNHSDYDKDLNFFVASCEFSGHLLVIDKYATQVTKVIDLNPIPTDGATPPEEAYHSGKPQAGLDRGASAMPQDVRLTPNGKYFLACDMLRNGVWVIDAATFEYVKFIQTGKGTHSVYPSRDTKRLFVSNRDEGTITVLNSDTLDIETKWTIPDGGSPDMGGVNAEGTELWLSGRYHAEVYVFDTTTGELKHRIKTDAGAHGLAVWPQPGRFSLGHTGNMR